MRHLKKISLTIIAAMTIAACGGTTSRTTSTVDGSAYSGPGFSNLLVIAVADVYNNRAMFERTLSQEISGDSVAATPYYSLTKMDDPIDRPTIEKIVNEGGFDAVLITRVLNRDIDSSIKVGSSSAKKVRKDADGVADLFRYDYQELNEPMTLSMEFNVVISSELFSVATSDRVWGIESDIADSTSVGTLVLEAADIVARELRRDDMLAD